MKKELQFDKYGFAVKDSYRNTYKTSHGSMLEVKICYVNNSKEDEVCFELPKQFKSSGLIKNINKQKRIVTYFKEKTITEAIAFVINSEYGYMENFTCQYDLIGLIEQIPEDLIMNNEAIKELLKNLPQDNECLLSFISNKIKEKRHYIMEKQNNK